ncbi:pentatricopeptide repeat-containing protein At5g15300-like [Telopea speciosissima]|uniref:pentatricopeptide repeat-containing protein At5g15300-like n=1 Tax=Telopea speciosissima TaxID=54955 RepID=UPI001CC6B24C|nr:pentatricopeptide repeat-containing protein At5g15300-like [Telopea speciosissima]
MWRAIVSSVLSILQQLSTMRELGQTQALITKTGLTGYPSVIAKFITFSALSTSGSLAYARAIFEETTMEDTFLCNTMLRAYSQSIFPIEAIFLYNQMQRMNVTSDHFTYPYVLKACARVFPRREEDEKLYGFEISVKGAEIHGRALQTGFVLDHFVQNSLIHLYSHLGFLDLARQVFDEMEEKTVASWNTMIAAYDRINDFESADLLLHSIPVKNVVSWNTLIARYVKLCNIEAARRMFEEMPEKDAVSWNSMIAGYVQSKDYNGALELFRQMQACRVEATDITLTSVLGACAEMGALGFGREIHELLKRQEFKIEGFLGNALLDMYAKCGSLNFAWEVFDGMKMKHVSCWNSMIVALAVHGYCEEALELFSTMEMRFDEVRPNRITFIGVLIACSHKGLVEEGRQYFARMIGEYKIRPDIKHYGCMVDLLSRCGLLDEAYHIIKTMPFDANSVLWRTLLGACRNYGHVELAEEAFRRLAVLEPLRDGDWVLLSNTYAEAKRWDDVERVRNEMIGLRILKKPGSSQIEVK